MIGKKGHAKRKRNRAASPLVATVVRHSEISCRIETRRRRADRLRTCFEVDECAGEIIVDLLQRIEGLDRELDRMRAMAGLIASPAARASRIGRKSR